MVTDVQGVYYWIWKKIIISYNDNEVLYTQYKKKKNKEK